jgi:hypothetical protein
VHRQTWGRIRSLAVAADATVDDFLHRSVVLTPERLEIGLRKSAQLAGDSVVEIEPLFAGAPPDWLERFDSAREVQDRYDIVTPEGIVQVLITPQGQDRPAGGQSACRCAASPDRVRRPSSSIRSRPWARTLKTSSTKVSSRRRASSAGLQYERFLPTIERDATGYPLRVGLLIETANASGPASSETVWLTDRELGDFTGRLENALARGFQLLGWQGYDFEVQGDTPRHLDELRAALQARA